MRSTVRFVGTVLTAAAATATSVGAVAAGSPVGRSAPASVAAVTAAPLPQRAYLVSSHRGTTARLQLVDRANGNVIRTVLTRPTIAGGNPFGDAVVGADGTAWVVQRTAAKDYAYSLLRVSTKGTVQTFMPYVEAVRLSPDGTRLAVSVVSPDTNHDGLGTTSIRIVPTSGRGVIKTVTSFSFPVRKDGSIALQTHGPMVSAWLGNEAVVASAGCCDSGAAKVFPINRLTSYDAARGHSASALTTPVARYGAGTVLVPVEGTATGAPVALYKITAANPMGVKVATLHADHFGAELTAYVKRTSGLPIARWDIPLPFKASQGWTRDDQFAGA